MKTCIKNPFLLPVLMAALGWPLADRVTAQTFSNLYSFPATSGPSGTNSNGSGPNAGLILAGNSLYGTTGYGGTSGKGTVFKFSTDGTGITNLHSFTAVSGPSPSTNSDGATPHAELILAGNILFGTAYQGGTSGYGAIFAIKTDGSGFTNLYNFPARTGPNLTNNDGANPEGGLILSGNTLYGTAYYGGSSGRGTVFAVKTNGTGFTNLHSFAGGANDGANPPAAVLLSGNILYGTTASAGSSNSGTVFAVNTNGTGYTNIHNFAGGTNDGALPYAGLILSGSALYGTTIRGGSEDAGTVFKVNTNGTGYTNLHAFTAVTGGFPQPNSDGTNPQGELVQLGGTLYGMTGSGGSSGYGTEFAVNADGTGFTNLHFHTYSDGYFGSGGLFLSGNTLYGAAVAGGNSGSGTLFSLSLSAPRLTITRFGTNVILTWPTNAPGFILQSTTNLISPAVWSTNSPAPVVVNGQNAVTNPISGAKQFFRLIQ